MIGEVGEEYRWVEKELSGPQYRRILDVRDRTKPIFENNILPHFTDHSLAHSDRVVKILGKLLKANLRSQGENRATTKEVTVLVLAALLHDIGMQIPLAHGIEKEIVELSRDDLSQIRRDHGRAAGSLLRNLADGDDRFHLGLDDARYRRHLPIVATLCEHHQSSETYDPEEEVDIGGRLRVGILTALLRIADQLDCDSRRVDMDKLHQFRIGAESRLHWLMCHYVDAVSIEDGLIQLRASFPEGMSGPVAELLAGQLVEKVSAEFSIAEKALWRNDIKLRPPSGIQFTGEDFTYQKQSLPDEVLEKIKGRLEPSLPKHLELADVTSPADSGGGELDFMTYWGFIGNPFLDRPIAYGSDLLVETPQLLRVVSETRKHLEGPKGDLKLVIGDRGLGKTTLFQTLGARLSDGYTTYVIDVADRVVDVRNVTEMHQIILERIHDSISVRPEEEPTPKRIVGLARLGNKKVICIDSLDRLPLEKSDIVRDFLKTSQKFLTDLRLVSVVLISCAKEWIEFLSSEELSYLGGRNQWKLEPFSTEDLVGLLDRRLRSSGSKYANVFDEGCAIALHTISEGNPRSVLEHAEAMCRLAARKGERRISQDFIHKTYQRDFDQNLQALLGSLGIESEKFKRGLTAFYLFYAEMERRNLDTNEGWRYLMRMLNGGMPLREVHPAYHAPLGYIGSISLATDGATDTHRKVYFPHKFTQDLFKRLDDKGYVVGDFVAFYSAHPIRPVEEDNRIMLELRSPLLATPDLEYFEKGRQLYLELRQDRKPPVGTITSAWDCIENMLLAILLRHTEYSVHKLDAAREEAFYEDRRGIKRYKRGAGRAFSEAAWGLMNDFMDFIKSTNQWVDHLPGMKWILTTRNNIIRGRAANLLMYGEKERDVCLRHLEPVFRELFEFYA